jgi:recombination protein RecT
MTNTDQQPQEPNKHPLVVFREQLAARETEFRAVLPPHISPQRFTRTALTAVQLNPMLLACDRRSLFNALQKCANDGVVADGRQAVILHYKDNNPNSPTKGQLVAQYQIMVDGMRDRFVNSGQFKEVDAEVVRDDDVEFKYYIDENGPHLMHVPGDGNGKIIKAYARALLKDGGKVIRVMSAADINRRRAVSKAKDGPMWREWYDEAAKKTVLRNLYKRLPSASDDLDRLVERDQELYGVESSDELPNGPRGVQQVHGVAAALDHFGGRAPETVEESHHPIDDPSSQSQGADQHGQEQQAPAADTADTATTPSQQGQASESPEDIARARGAEAKRQGVARRGVPGEYRSPERETEAEAWRQGWDSAN